MGSRVKKYRMKPIPSAFSEKGGFNAQFVGDGYSIDARTEILHDVLRANAIPGHFVRAPLLSSPRFGKIRAVFRLGGVSEWSMVQPWKGCVGATPPGVRIPPPPPTR